MCNIQKIYLKWGLFWVSQFFDNIILVMHQASGAAQGDSLRKQELSGLSQLPKNHLKLKQDIILEAEKMLRGEPPTSTSKQVISEARRLVDKTNTLKYQECSMEALQMDGYNLVNLEENRMAIFPLQSSGSSEEQIEPIYQSNQEIVDIISGVPEICNFYILAKVMKDDTARLDYKISIVKAFKGADDPKIILQKVIDSYYLFKITSSSAVRKFSIEVSCKGYSNVQEFDFNKNKTLLLGSLLSFDSNASRKLQMNSQQEIMVLSLVVDREGENQLLQAAKRIKKYSNFSTNEFTTSFSSLLKLFPNQQMFSQILLIFLENTSPEEARFQSIYKFLGEVINYIKHDNFSDSKSFGVFLRKTCLLLQHEQNKKFGDMAFFSLQTSKSIVGKLFTMINSSENASLLLENIQFFSENKLKILNEYCTCHTFIEEFVLKCCQNNFDSLQAQISAIYYYTLSINGAVKIQVLVDGIQIPGLQAISNQLDKIDFSKLKIMMEHQTFVLKNIKAPYFYQFLCILENLVLNENMFLFLESKVIAQAKEYLIKLKETLGHEKETKILSSIILILKKVTLEGILLFLIPEDGDFLQNSCIKLLSNKTAKESFEILKKFNQELFLVILEKGRINNLQNLMTQYKRVLQTKERKTAFLILSFGMGVNTPVNEGQDRNLNRIIEDLFKFYYESMLSFDLLNRQWHDKFIFAEYVNQKIMEKMMSLSRKRLQNLDMALFFDQTERNIRNHANPQSHQERLLIIVKMENMEIDEQHILENLKSNEKIYLLIFESLIQKGNGGDERGKKLHQIIRRIGGNMLAGQYPFEQLEKMIAKKSKDVTRFNQLFGLEAHLKVKTQCDEISQKIQRLNKVKEYLSFILEKYNTNEHEFKAKQSEISKKIEELKTSKTNQTQAITTFAEQFPPEIIILSKQTFFYKNRQLLRQTINGLIEINGEQLNLFHSKLSSIVEGLKQGSLYYDNFQYLELFSLKDKQVKQILSLYKSVVYVLSNEDKAMIENAIRRVKKMRIYIKAAKALLFFIEYDAEKIKKYEKDLRHFGISFEQVKVEQTISLSQIQVEEEAFEKILQEVEINKSEQIYELNNIFPLDSFTLEDISRYQITEENKIILVIILFLHERINTLEQLALQSGKILQMKEYLRQNIDDQLTLKETDMKNYADVLKFYHEEVLTLRKNGARISSFIHRLKRENSREILENLVSILGKAQDFKYLYMKIKDPKYAESLNIGKILEDSDFLILLKTEKVYNVEFQISSKLKGLDKQIINEQKMQRFKDEALVILSRSEGQQDNASIQVLEIRKRMNRFLQFYKVFESIKRIEKTLMSYGYIFFQDQTVCLHIENGDFEGVEKYCQKREVTLKEWKTQIQIIYGMSANATMLKGQKLKTFYRYLIGKEGKSKYFRYICAETILEDIKKKIRKPRGEEPFQCLEIISQFFKELQTIEEKVQSKDRDEQYVRVVKIFQQENDYIKGLEEMNDDKLKKIGDGQVLRCIHETTFEDLESFIQRAIRNIDNEYVLMGYENLSLQFQAYIIDRIERTRNQNNLRIKLNLVGNSEKQKIFRYVSKELNIAPEKIEKEAKASKQTYQEFMKDRIIGNQKFGPVQIYQSSRPGLGKTEQILEDLQKKKLKPLFFPISGRISSEKLFKRLSNRTEDFELKNQKYGVIIQIYDVELENKQALNQFLTQICLWRSFCYRSEFCCLNTTAPIYIEEQRPMKKPLPFLKILKQMFKDKILVEIKDFSLNKLKVSKENKKLAFILAHLNHFEEGKMDAVDLPDYQNFQPIIPPNAYDLLNKYFVEKIKDASVNPSYYLYQYWISLFYESCVNFTFEYIIKVSSITSNYPSKVRKQFKIEKFRSEFFKILAQNSIEFLAYSVKDLSENQQNHQQQNRQMSFLIIPNQKKQWFSFIYEKSDQIPEQIRNFLIANESLRNQNKGKTFDQMKENVFKQHELALLQQKDPKEFLTKVRNVLRDISGNNSYELQSGSSYSINMDNFKKMCIISYRMNVNMPLVIQGEAGIGKTALLRHLLRDVFQYKFISKTLNAGFDQGKIENILQETESIIEGLGQQSKDRKEKICLFLDEFNTSPELGHIKELILQKKFMGQERSMGENLIIFAACNPYRKVEGEKAFQVKKIPLSIGQVLWDFGKLKDEDVEKYVFNMLHEIQKDLMGSKMAKTIFQIQKKLGQNLDTIVSLRDIERLRKIYHWLKVNLSKKSSININQTLEQHYDNERLRSVFIAISLTYLVRLGTENKRKIILKVFDDNSIFRSQDLISFKQFEEEDFCNRIKIQYEGVALNSALKENLYCCFVSMMICLPMIIVGKPGCSKSMAARIIRENFKEGRKIQDEWLKRFPILQEIPFQGSGFCTSESVEKIFVKAKDFVSEREGNEKKRIPVIVFDEMGLAEKAPDNPLKVIHQPLELVSNEADVKERQIGFLGISNTQLDKSKMSRFLTILRPDLTEDDLINVSIAICKSILKKTWEKNSLYEHISKICYSYIKFIDSWKLNHQKELAENFYGLRDFYNLIKTFADLIKANEGQTSSKKLDEFTRKAIFRNFSGFSLSYESFLEIANQFFQRQLLSTKEDVLSEVIFNLLNGGRRYPLIILKDQISLVALQKQIEMKAKDRFNSLTGSPFAADSKNSEYIVKNLSKIIRKVEKNNILMANSLNNTVETALFDLFNKLFIKRGADEMYRVAMESGLMFTEIVHPNFNICLSINQSELSKVSPAFLNRFEKYNFDKSYIENEQANKVKIQLQNLKEIIKNALDKEKLEFYKFHHLFMNFSSRAEKSLLEKVILEFGEAKKSDEQIVKRLILYLCRICTKDFEYIFKYVFLPNNALEEKTELFQKGLANKEIELTNSENAIILTSDVGLWRGKNEKDWIIQLQLFGRKTERELERQIKHFLKSGPEKTTLYIDLQRQPTGNVNDMNRSEDQIDPVKVSVGYIIETCLRLRQDLKQEEDQIGKKQIRLVLKYNRNRAEEFTPISYLSKFEIFASDGSTLNFSDENKNAIFENISMDKMIKTAIEDCFEFTFKEEETDEEMKKIFNESFLFNICNSQSLLVNNCKEALMILEGNNIKIEQDDVLKSIKNAELMLKYDNIQKVLTQSHFSTKIKGALAFFIEQLTKSQIFLSYGGSILVKMFQLYVRDKKSTIKSIEEDPTFRRFMTEMMKKKMNLVKTTYTNLKRQKHLKYSKENKKIIELKRPKCCPYSYIQLDFAFHESNHQVFQTLSEASDEFETIFKQKEEDYKKRLAKAFNDNFIFGKFYQKLNSQWIKRFQLDMVVKFLELNRISIQQAVTCLTHLNNFCSKVNTNKIYKMIILLGAKDIWCSIFSIVDFCSRWNLYFLVKFQQNKRISAKENSYNYLKALIATINKNFNLNEDGMKTIKGDDEIQKRRRFFKAYSSLVLQIQNIINIKLIQENDDQVANILINSDFVTFWISLHQKHQTPYSELDYLLKQLRGAPNLSKKIQEIYIFLSKLVENKPFIKDCVYKYFANKLFPKWFLKSSSQEQESVAKNFLQLCNKSELFTHNSVGSMKILFSRLNLDFTKKSIEDLVQQLTKIGRNYLYSLDIIGTKCFEDKFCSNISVLICNMFYGEMWRNRWMLSSLQGNEAVMDDLKTHQRKFQASLNSLKVHKKNGISQILHFAFMKLYLFHYVQLMDSKEVTCKKISDTLCEDIGLCNSLRLYCLKVLRKNLKTKDIHTKFIKSSVFSWTDSFKNYLVESASRSIAVPISPSLPKQSLELEKIFKESTGQNLNALEELIKSSKGNNEKRYQVLSLFLKYIYSQAYSFKQYEKSLKDFMAAKKTEFTEIMGEKEYQLLVKYTQNKIHESMKVESHDNFNEDELIILNNINWLLSSTSKQSPLHSLFFSADGKLQPDIFAQLQASFLPCGPENPYITITKGILEETRKNNIGVYICGNNCDYIYCHQDCGWPRQSWNCPMCGQIIGNQKGLRSHRLARRDQGARRVMSEKLIDNSSFYVWNMTKMQEFWEAQRYYIIAEINRMRRKESVTLNVTNIIEDKKVTSIQTINLKGYNLSTTHDRVSKLTSKIIMLSFESLLLSFIALGSISEDQCEKLFKTRNLSEGFQKQQEKTKKLLTQIKQVVGLEGQFYGWIYGVQQQFYQFLNNFGEEFKQEVENKKIKTKNFLEKIKAETKQLNKADYKTLYEDCSRVIEQGLAYRQFEQVLNSGDMTLSNQFTREIIQNKMESIVSKHMENKKLEFAIQNFEVQGKMQFQFDRVMVETELREVQFPYSRILKTPCQELNPEQIIRKTETVVKEKYPVLDYLFRNRDNLETLNILYLVLSTSNKLKKKADYKLSREGAEQISIQQFGGDQSYANFFNCWRRLANKMGSIQVECKTFGTMNDQFTEKSAVGNFLVDTISKVNANGKIIVGLLHNLAKNHNECLNLLKNRKNQVAKYRDINIFLDNVRISPQEITRDQCILLEQKSIFNKVMQNSVASIVYGENEIYHNFELCESELLLSLKGVCEIEDNIENFITTKFVGDSFCRDTPGQNSDAIGLIKDKIIDKDEKFKNLNPQEIEKINSKFERLSEKEKVELKGQLEYLILYLKKNDQIPCEKNILDFCLGVDDTIELAHIKEFDNIGVGHIISIYELIELNLAPTLIANTPKRYRQKLTPELVTISKDFIRRLPANPDDAMPTGQQLRVVLIRFMTRNLGAETFDEKKTFFDNILSKEDFWPEPQKMYDYLGTIASEQVYSQLLTEHIFQFLQLLESSLA